MPLALGLFISSISLILRNVCCGNLVQREKRAEPRPAGVFLCGAWTYLSFVVRSAGDQGGNLEGRPYCIAGQ